MADLIDLQSASDKHILNDDATPTLKLTNTNASLAGKGLSASSIEVTTPASKIAAANATVINGITIAASSVASGAVLKFNPNALVSLTSVLATTGGVAGTHGVRVAVADGVFGWIPVYPDGAVTGAAI
jgi:hypothetical protein